MRRRPVPFRGGGFTLVEILVSILIFVVAGSVMIGVLLGATELFRGGESARLANDEAVAVLGALDSGAASAAGIDIGQPR